MSKPKYGNFVSDLSIKAREEELSTARKSVLEKAKKKYEASEIREKKKKESGEATWMLDTVSKRIHKEQKTLEDAKSKKKKKKKEKKKKKKHHKRSHSSASSSDDDDEDETWVETKAPSSSCTSQTPSEKIQRDGWMEAPLDLFPTVTRQQLRDEANREKEIAKREAEKHLQPGQHAKELNPYWKNGGTGLPSAQPSSTSSSSTSGLKGDGGLSWMLKSLSRMKEQAREEGRSLEDIAAERYGSLNRLMSMIHDAEKPHGRERDGHRRHTDSRDRDRHSDKYQDRGSDRSRGRESIRDDNKQRERSNKVEDKRHNDGRDRDRMDTKTQSNQSSRFRRPGSDDEGNHRDYDRKDRNREESKNSSSGRSSGFRRPGSDDDSDAESRRNRKTFRKPEESVGNNYSRSSSSSSYSRREDEAGDRRKEYDDRRQGYRDNWRKSHETDDSRVPRWKKNEAKDVKGEKERKFDKKSNRSSSESSSSDSGSDQSDDEGNGDKNKKSSDSEEETPARQPPKVMSETQLNELAAKVLRAEIMGDEALVSQLKATLEEARRVRESSKAAGSDGKGEVKDFDRSKKMERGEGDRKRGQHEDHEGDDNVVVLSRTNKAGMVRPVLPSSSSSEWGQKSGGRKRKRKNVTTHDEGGERTKFFHDDDNFDLKTLVEREKAGTAEDQNSMFARLAGRENDRDLDVDDMFVNKAAKGREEEEAINRDKMAAIMEHRKKSSAMEKCTRCFDKIPKHLIIAIGRKSYLCLPDHASLTEGHCLIIPMAHSTSATTLDEDVWQDIQQFRKSLVRMFLSQEKDVVVMETVMNLKYFPHMAIECIPLEQELGDLAPIYFKKAIQDVGPEWSHNKKVHDLSKKDVRHTIPKGFPYFSVDFGLQGGFAHVIEDEATFPGYFGREIVGGMLDTEPGLWRKPRKQNFEDQRQKVLQFEQWWSPFDWTKDIG